MRRDEDCIKIFREKIILEDLIKENELEKIDNEVHLLVEDAVKKSKESKFPSPDELLTDVYSEYWIIVRKEGIIPEKTFRTALNEALIQEMDRDENIIIFGEDVCGGTGGSGEKDAWGGAFGVTKGFWVSMDQKEF